MAPEGELRLLYLMYCGLLQPGGEQSLNLHRLRTLERMGARTWVAAQEPPPFLQPEATKAIQEEVHRLAPSATLDFYRRRSAFPRDMVRHLTQLSRKQRLDLLIFTNVQSMVAVRSLKAAVGIPALWDSRAGADARLLERGGAIRRLKNLAFRWGYGPTAKLSDHILCVSEQHADHMVQRFGYPRSRITVAPNGTDTSLFRPDPEARAAIRSQLGLSSETLVLAFCGAVLPWQCVPESVELFRRFLHLRGNAHLLMITPHLDHAHTLAGELVDQGLCSLVSVPHRDVAQYLAAADLGLLLRRPTPRNAVASPTKFAEYMACGLPTAIGPGVGDYTDLVSSRRLGVVVEPDAPESWDAAAQELVALFEEGPQGARARCREAATEMLSTDVQSERFAAAVRETLNSVST
jgi:glycosyltransferase involved in cell wall biosynthesis